MGSMQQTYKGPASCNSNEDISDVLDENEEKYSKKFDQTHLNPDRISNEAPHRYSLQNKLSRQSTGLLAPPIVPKGERRTTLAENSRHSKMMYARNKSSMNASND